MLLGDEEGWGGALGKLGVGEEESKQREILCFSQAGPEPWRVRSTIEGPTVEHRRMSVVHYLLPATSRAWHEHTDCRQAESESIERASAWVGFRKDAVLPSTTGAHPCLLMPWNHLEPPVTSSQFFFPDVAPVGHCCSSVPRLLIPRPVFFPRASLVSSSLAYESFILLLPQ